MLKRIVLTHTQGPLAGLRRIMGTADETLPEFIEGINFVSHMGSASLITIKPRYAMYRETFVPETAVLGQTFHPSQR